MIIMIFGSALMAVEDGLVLVSASRLAGQPGTGGFVSRQVRSCPANCSVPGLTHPSALFLGVFHLMVDGS